MSTLLPVDPSNAVAVTDYLTKARDWLNSAVETSTPLGIGQAKVELAVAAEATKQLNLSQEIQEDAAEMVRRAEFVLRKAVTKAQENGEVKGRGADLVPGARTGNHVRTASSDLPSPKDFFGSQSEYDAANTMAALDEDEFNDVLTEAKAEGNLSRANVARKAKEKAGGQSRRMPRPAAEKTLSGIQIAAARAARDAQTLTPDQIRRVKAEASDIVASLRNSIEVLEHLANSLDN